MKNENEFDDKNLNIVDSEKNEIKKTYHILYD